MKRVQFYLFLVLVVCLFSSNFMTAFSVNTGFLTEELPEEDANIFISNVDISLLEDEPVKSPIVCFDVSENGLIVMGQENMDKKMVSVYSSDGVFQYGFTFNCGQSFGVEWDGNDINIYFVRSDVLLQINQEGQILDIAKIPITIENDAYGNDMLYSTERTVGNTKYTIKNDMGILNVFAASHSQLIVTKPTGEEIMIYDVNAIQFVKILCIFVFSVSCFILAVAVIVRQIIKQNRNPSGNTVQPPEPRM